MRRARNLLLLIPVALLFTSCNSPAGRQFMQDFGRAVGDSCVQTLQDPAFQKQVTKSLFPGKKTKKNRGRR